MRVPATYDEFMVLAAWWGFVSGAALLVGALIALKWKVPTRLVGLTMAFGAGVLISAVAFDLMLESYESGGLTPALLGLACGSLTFFAGDWAIDNMGGHRRKSPLHGGLTVEQHAKFQGAGASSGSADGGQAVPVKQAAAGSSMALVLGALLDGIPESASIGISLLGPEGVGLSMVAAVFLSNVPESLSATAGLKASGKSTRSILMLWGSVVLASTLAALLGYALLGGASVGVTAFIQTFAAGAIITMLADTMIPEATEHAGRWVGLFTMIGFAMAFVLNKV